MPASAIEREIPAEAAKVKLPGAAVDAHCAIEERVEGVRRRRRWKYVLTGGCLALAIFAAAFLGFSLVDIFFKLSVGSRLFWMALTLGGMAAALFLAIVKPWRQLGDTVRVAQEVEGRYPELEDQLSTALEYGRDERVVRATSSPELVGALLRQTHKRSAPLDFRQTVRWRTVAWAALAAFLVSSGVALYRVTNKRLFNATFQRFLMPTAAIPAPTLTLIEDVQPGDGEVPVETSLPVSVKLSGLTPERATLSVLVGDEREGRWEERVMERGEDGRYHATLRRLLDTVRYRIKAGDAQSGVFRVQVYREPQVDEFTLRLAYPAYTGKAPETLPAGMGQIRALRGTRVSVQLKANTALASARAVFSSGRPPAPAEVEGRRAHLSFAVQENERYELEIENTQGRRNHSPASYRIRALRDAKPRVRIKRPGRDRMVFREQIVKVEIEASDDVGLGEIGIFHSLGLEEKKKLIRRFQAPFPERGKARFKWNLGQLGLKGGEVIAYYAYALDNDTLHGPKMAKSEIHFLTVYDEEQYDAPQSPEKHSPPTPESIRQLDKLLNVQKKLLQETFAMARLREQAEDERAAVPKTKAGAKVEGPWERAKREQAAAAKTAQAQRELKEKLEGLTEEVRAELKRLAEQGEPKARPGGGPVPPRPALSEKELKLMQKAAGKMEKAAGKLDANQPAPAVRPEMEALRNLSETRRLLLSDKEGDPRFKMAMNRQAKKNRKKRQSQQQRDQQSAREELAELPPMLEREKKLEREVEKLEEQKRTLRKPQPQPQPQPATGAPPPPPEEKKKDAPRSLKRKTMRELDQLAQKAQERAENLRELARRNAEMKQAAEQAQQAAQKLQDAQKSLNRGKQQEAQQKLGQAQQQHRKAQRSLRNALQKQLRQEMANLKRDAEELAQRQNELAQASQRMQRQAAQPQQGQPKQGQPKQGQPKQGQPKQGQPKQGQPQQGQPQQGGAPSERDRQRMRFLAGKQQEVAEDMKDLAARLKDASGRARRDGLPAAKPLQEAQQQSGRAAPGQQAANKAREQLQRGQAGQAEHDQRKAVRALDAVSRKIQEAIQKTLAGDMKELAQALKKAQALARAQGDVRKDIARKRAPIQLAEREQKIAEAAEKLASASGKLEALKRQGRARNAEERLKQAAKQSGEAARRLAGQDAKGAQKPAAQAQKALQGAVHEMERAAGKTMEQQAKEARKLAARTRKIQEKAAATARELPQPKAGRAFTRDAAGKRDEAAEKERQAARLAKRLEKSLEGLEELAREASPAAAEVAREALTASQEKKLPQRMETLAKGLRKIGNPKKAAETPNQPPPAPNKAAQQGDRLAQEVKAIEQKLEQFTAEATGDQLSKLRALEQEARDAARRAKEMAQDLSPKGKPSEKGAPGKPPGKKNPPGQNPSGKNDFSAKAKRLERDLKNLEPKLKRLEPGAPELKQLRQAQEALQEAERQAQAQAPGKAKGQPRPSKSARGGKAIRRASTQLDSVSRGLVERIERILKAREIRPETDESAPKEYRKLVEKYYRALSEDVEEQR